MRLSSGEFCLYLGIHCSVIKSFQLSESVVSRISMQSTVKSTVCFHNIQQYLHIKAYHHIWITGKYNRVKLIYVTDRNTDYWWQRWHHLWQARKCKQNIFNWPNWTECQITYIIFKSLFYLRYYPVLIRFQCKDHSTMLLNYAELSYLTASWRIHWATFTFEKQAKKSEDLSEFISII